MSNMSFQKGALGFLRRAVSSYDREEQGYPPAHDSGNISPGGVPRSFSVATTDAAALVPPGDKLLIFRSLTGIDTVPALLTNGHSVRSAPNVGIYTRVVRNERKATVRHTAFRFLVSTCLGVQIVVAATLTAIGAANGSHKAVTAFGAINTIIAGLLTYLKGSGLPTKLRNKKDEWKKVREYIEQLMARDWPWPETQRPPPTEPERPTSLASIASPSRRPSLRPDVMPPARIAEEKQKEDV
ncbi:C6 transcription factor [Fusarium albosuccineum]|uniref:C6 transcription factor n=1 Tax=Fusarium albosuccineum TaxID=1237068 RepID=A0A8H4PFI3_9HYPO|nr:C6 transcription factor [Fusarium albosuccineum]